MSGDPALPAGAAAAIRANAALTMSVALSPDGRRLASGGGYRDRGEIKLWDATAWEGKTRR